MDLENYYKKMDTEMIMREFNELVAEWQQGRAIQDPQITNALSAIWREMKSRGTDLGPCERYGNPRELGYW